VPSALPPTPPPRVKRWLREPLLHFLLAGLALFLVYRGLNPSPVERDASNQIKLTEDDLRHLTTAWVAQGRPSPTPEQMRALVEAKVREEVLYREALALGLDKNDSVVKRRLAQKMELLADDVSVVREPTPDELQAWFEKNRERFALPSRATFRHVYFSPERRGAEAQSEARAALAKLDGKPSDWPMAPKLGDPFMFEAYYGDRSREQVAEVFGPQFAQSLFGLRPKVWQGPVESGLGWHLVFIDDLTRGRVPDFADVAADARTAWLGERRAEAKRKAYEAMRARYEVVLPGSFASGETP